MSSLYLSRLTCRLVTLSPASKQEKTHVLWTALGVSVFAIWKFILNDPPPLSPPILIQISSFGMTSPCQVSLPALKTSMRLQIGNVSSVVHYLEYFSFCSRSWMTLSTKFGMKACAAALISSPPPARLNEKGAFSVSRLSPICSFAITLCFLSLDSETPEDLSHLVTHTHYLTFPILVTCISVM